MQLLTNDDEEYWAGYIRELADNLRLKDWHIFLSGKHDVPDEDVAACIKISVGRKGATITLGPDFVHMEPGEQRQTLVHELIHIHLEPVVAVMDRLAETRTEGWLHLARTYLNDAQEQSVDIMADIIAPFMPMPPLGRIKNAIKRGKKGEGDAG